MLLYRDYLILFDVPELEPDRSVGGAAQYRDYGGPFMVYLSKNLTGLMGLLLWVDRLDPLWCT